MRTYTAVIHFDEESQTYVGVVPALPGVATFGDSIEQLKFHLAEAIELMLETMENNDSPVTDIEILLEPITINS